MRRPTEFLRDVINELDPGGRAALGCVYVSGDGVPTPVTLTPSLHAVATRLGATAEQVLPAFSRLDGSFLRLESQPAGPAWQFRHPTLREGFAASVTGQPDAVGILIDGLSDDELLRQVDCGGHGLGTVVSVPPSLYGKVAARVRLNSTGYSRSDLLGVFLKYRTGEQFLRVWARAQAADLPRLVTFGMYVSAHWQPAALARLNAAGALPEDVRRKAVERLAALGRDFDPGWLEPNVLTLFTKEEAADELAYFKEQVLPELDQHIEQSADGYDDTVTPEQRYETAREAIRLYSAACHNDPEVIEALNAASRAVDTAVQYAEYDYKPSTDTSLAADDRPYRVAPAASRDEFDDVDVGH